MNLNKHSVWNKIKNRWLGGFPRVSYSRSGEDLIIEEFFRNKMSGFYVDIGAYHPIDHSNSYKYYLKGWRGINIDPSIETIDSFNKVRPEDVNLNIAIGEARGSGSYFIFKNDASMNTISENFYKESEVKHSLLLQEKREVKIDRLENVLKEYKPPTSKIDFLSVDVEGSDLQVLQSNNWDIYRPQVLCVEVDADIFRISENDICTYLASKSYSPVAYTFINKEVGNVIFTDNSFAA